MNNQIYKLWGKVLRVGVFVLCGGIGLTPGIAGAWGSFRDTLGDLVGEYNTHAALDLLAWDRLAEELEPPAMLYFPRQWTIFGNDFVEVDSSLHQLPSSTGPDYEPYGGSGPITLFSTHYRNATIAANHEYNNLIADMKARSPRRSHSAAWAAHFLADQYVPYHNLGVQYTGQDALALDSPSYSDSPGDFIAAAEAAANGHLDWYDPSYWDSSINTNNSTHIYWERQISYPSFSSPGVDPLWSNTEAEPMRAFVGMVQSLTTSDFDNIVANGNQAARDAARGVYTAWRSTLSAFQVKLNVASSDEEESFLVSAVVKNDDKLYDANTVTAEIILPPGLTTTDPLSQSVNENGVLPKKVNSQPVSWNVSGSSAGCPEIKVKVKGQLDEGIPDAAAMVNGGVEATVLPPPVVAITSPAAGTTINESKVTVTGTFSDEASQAWLEVNGSDKIWISEGFASGATFSKEVPLKQGENTIVVKSINQCKKEGSATITVTGNFTEPAIKVVMSWDTNGTDVDLHFTDSNGGPECYYRAKNPGWGDPASTADDPLLDIDNTTGYGPETITLQAPKPGSYTVRVVYYSDHNSETAIPSFVTIKVYEYGEPKGTFTQTLGDTGATWEGVYTFVITDPAPVALVTQASVADYTVSENRITTRAVATQPAIHGQEIVWTDARNGPFKQIYRFDLTTSEESRVSSANLNESLCRQSGPAIGETAVVWEDYRRYTPSLYSYDLNTAVEVQQTSAETMGNSRPAVSGDLLVWEDTRNSSETEGNADIYLRNLSAGTETQITTDPADQLAPDISGNRIVWTDTRFGGYTIFLYDLTSSNEQQIARASSGSMNPPAIDGDLVVWEDGRSGNGDIYLYDLGTHEERQLTTDGAEQTLPDVSGNKVVWVDYRNGNPDIYMFDVETGVEVPICTNVADQREPRISGNRIVWTDYRNGSPDIYMAEINATTPVVTLTVPDKSATEAGRTPGKFKVTRSGETTTPLTVFYTVDGTATSGNDFQALSGEVTIPAGTSEALITVTPINDPRVEANETVEVTLVVNGAYQLAPPLWGTVTITSDDALPGAPTIGTATAGNRQARVTFTPPTATGGNPITRYTVTSTPGGKTATGPASPLTVTGLTNGTAYTFKVKATTAVGTGPASAASNSVTPRATAQVPGAPTIGTATAGNRQATVTFTPPSATGGSPITSYTVTSTPGGQTATGPASPLTVTGLTNGTAYTFKVQATNAVGTGPASAASNSVTPQATAQEVPGAPTIGTATAGNRRATVTFTPPTATGGSPITSYTVTSTPGGQTATGPASPLTVTGLTNGTAYTFTVQATNAVGTGPASAASNSVTPSASGANFAIGPLMPVKRMNHTNVTLNDGRVVLFGGHGTGFVSLNTAAVWNPSTQAFTGKTMKYPHDGGALVRLADGRYLLAGGAANLGVAPGYNTAEIFTPATGAFSSTGTMVHRRMSCGAALLTGGKVLVVGGWYDDVSGANAELYNPATGTFVAAGTLNTPRAQPIVLPTNDGKAVVLGGIGVQGTPSIEQVELYDPASKQFSIVRQTLFSGDSGWRINLASYSRPLDTQRLSNGKYLLMADKSVGSDTQYLLFTFDPATKNIAKFNTLPALPPASASPLWPPVVDSAQGKAYLFSYLPPYASPLKVQLYTVDLGSKSRNSPTGSYTLPSAYFPSGCGLALLKDGRLLITGGHSQTGYNTNFSPIAKSLIANPLANVSP